MTHILCEQYWSTGSESSYLSGIYALRSDVADLDKHKLIAEGWLSKSAGFGIMESIRLPVNL